MGMFDWFVPADDLRCPVCEASLDEWQSKAGPCALLVWNEWEAAPLEQRVDEEYRLSFAELQRFTLPDLFIIYSYDCGCPFPAEASCKSVDGVWSATELITAENYRKDPLQTKAQFKERLLWLQGRTA
jgi:hypothetical protein